MGPELLQVWLARKQWPISCLRLLAVLTPLLLVYRIDLHRKFDLPHDYLHETFEYGGYGLQCGLAIWQFLCMSRIRREQLRIQYEPAPDYLKIVVLWYRGLVALAVSTLLVGIYTLVLFGVQHFVDIAAWASAAQPTTSSRAEELRDPDAEELEILFREGSFESTDGWIESVYSQLELVQKKVYLSRDVVIDAKDIELLDHFTDDQGKPALSIRLSRKGARKMRDASEGGSGKSLALIINNKVRLVARMNGLLGESIMVSGWEPSEIDRIVSLFARHAEFRRN